MSTTRLFVYINCSHQDKNQRLQLTLFRASMVNIKSTQRAFKFFLPAEYAVMYMCYQEVYASQFWDVVNFCLSLLSAYWVLSTYFLAVFETSVSTY